MLEFQNWLSNPDYARSAEPLAMVGRMVPLHQFVSIGRENCAASCCTGICRRPPGKARAQAAMLDEVKVAFRSRRQDAWSPRKPCNVRPSSYFFPKNSCSAARCDEYLRMNERRMCSWLLHSGFRRKQGLVSVWWVVLWPRKAEITCLKTSNSYCYPNS